MKQISIFILFLVLLPACLFSQNKKGTTELKTFNLTTLSGEIPYYVSEYLRDNTPEQLKRHPEYGRLPYDAPCQNCVEVIEKRTAESRFFVDKDNPNHFYTQQSKGAMHYQDPQGFWRYNDPRLIQQGNGVYEAFNQFQPKKLDLKQQYVAIYHAGKELKFNRNLKLWHQDANGQKNLVASANWSDYTVGDEGVRVKNIFPGVDMEAGFDARAIKTDFVIRQKPAQTNGTWLIEDELDVPKGFYFAKNPNNKIQQDNDGSYKGNIWVMNEKGENHFTLGQIIAYDARPATRGKGISLAYLLDEEAKKYQMRIPLDWLQDSKTVYPVTIDPIVTGPQAIYNAGNIPFVDPGSGTWSAYCSNFLTVTRPNNSAITNIYFDMEYVALDWLNNGAGCGILDCWLSDAAFTIHSTCGQSPPLNLFWTVASPGGDGPGSGTNTNTPAPDLVSCLPPACTGTATFELRTYSYFSCSAGCVTDCHYVPNGAWRMTMEGQTLGANPVVVTGGSTTICQGQSATLTANHQGGVPTFGYLWSPGGATTSSITVSPASTTNYTVQITDNCGTIVNANQTITVNTPANAEFIYGAAAYCSSDPNPLPIHNAGGVDGTYTATPAGLSLNAATGLINLAASTPGTYTVTNTVTAGAPCPSATANFVVTIVPGASAEFQYDNTSYCQGGAAPVLSHIAGGTDGVYTAAPAGLSLNSATGAINLAASTPGTYTVTNTVTNTIGGATCTDVETFTLTITASPDASFAYNGSSFCLSGADPILTVTGVAGIFTSVPALGGLASNGAISLAASAAGNYTITNTVTVAGCTSTASVPLTLVTSPVADFAYDLPSYCQNAAAPVLSYLNGGIAGTFTAAPAGLSINATTGAVNLAASAAGTYTVTNTINLGGCQDVATTTLDVLATPDASFSYNAASFCQSGANPVLTVTGVAGNFTSVPVLGGLSSNGSISLAASAAGSYTITNTVTVAGCTGTFSTPVTINLAPIADFNYSSATFCQNAANPLPNFVNGGSAGTFTSNPVGLSLNSATGLINLAASTAGTYTVTNTQTSAGCPNDVETFSVTLVAVPNAEFSYTAASFCQTTGFTATPQHLAGGVNGTYTATPAGLIINAATGVIDLAASVAGTYTVTNTVSGAGVCPNDVETTTITLVSPGNAQFTYGSNVFCISGGTNPTASYPTGGSAGTFSAAPAGLSINTLTGTINLAASAVGTYTVTNTLPASGPCLAVSATQIVTIGNTANAEFSYTSATFCQTGTNPLPQHLAGGIDGTYTATAGLIINAATGEINLAASTPGTYVVTNTIAATGGCAATSFTQSVTITPAPDANFSYGAAAFCQSGTNPVPGHPNGGTDGTYTGAPGGISVNPATGEINLAASLPGAYTITNTVAGNAGCAAATFTQSVTINPPLNAEFAYTSNTYCNSGTAIPQFLTGGVAGTFSYTVVSGGPTLALNPVTGEIDLALSSPGVYQVTNALGANAGCAGTSFMQVIVISPAPSADFTYNASSYCITGNNPVVILAPGALNGAFTYTSSTGGTLALDPNNGSIVLSGSTPGTYTITNSIPASNGCSGSTFSQTITISAGGDAEFTYDKVAYCKAGANPILSHTTGTDGTYTYTVVSGGPSLSLDAATGAINLAASDIGVYQVTNTLAATSGCASDVKSVNIAIEGAPDAEFYYDRSIYCGNQIPFISHLSGVNGTYAYQVLSGGPTILLNPTNGSIDLTFSNPGTYQITNIVQGGACPADTHSVIITYAGKPVATINPTGFFDLCTVGSITLQTSGGAAYQWLNYGQATGNINNSYTVSAAGNYSAVVYNSAGCSDTSDVVVIQSVNLPSADLVTSPQTICPGESATLLGIGQGNLQWSYNGVPIQGANASSLVVNQAGIYTLSASNYCGTDSAITSLNLSAGPQADFLWEPTTIYAGQLFNFIDQSLSGYAWSWNFGNGGTSNLQNPTNVYTNPGVYPVSVYVTDAFGCKDTVNKLVTVTVISIDSVFVPNTFTPNGDGVHDEFGVDARGFKDYQIEIFDRWGVRVFETTASNKKWGGLNLNGVPCASGVYFYVLKLTDDAGKEYVKKSNIHLIR